MGDTAFDQRQFDVLYPPGVELHYWSLCRNRIIARYLRRHAAPGPILEVGCGKGVVVSYLRDKGFPVVGVELAPVTPLPGMEPFVRTGFDVNALGSGEASTYRTVLLLDVIEHLPDPRGFLMMLKTRLPGLQLVLVTVPARQELFSNFDRFNGHFRRYDGAMVSDHLAPCAAGGMSWSYAFHLLYPAARLQLRLRGAREVGFRVPGGALGRWVHRMIAALLYFDHLLIPSTWKGTSIIACARIE
ncbi:MAG: class I SAM-dependent methyltransferase [Flavobacteriales bacterium]|nr:class I SAM-dependent methyltransferase [Flavobacteriales bacterium]